jgi:hypothetical protein
MKISNGVNEYFELAVEIQGNVLRDYFASDRKMHPEVSAALIKNKVDAKLAEARKLFRFLMAK